VAWSGRPAGHPERTLIDDARWRAAIEQSELGAGLRVYVTDAEDGVGSVRSNQAIRSVAPGSEFVAATRWRRRK
jgi:hypothetical protein